MSRNSQAAKAGFGAGLVAHAFEVCVGNLQLLSQLPARGRCASDVQAGSVALDSDLEQRLRVRLVHRTTRKLGLTEAGEVFIGRCREILSNIEESESEISTR